MSEPSKRPYVKINQIILIYLFSLLISQNKLWENYFFFELFLWLNGSTVYFHATAQHLWARYYPPYVGTLNWEPLSSLVPHNFFLVGEGHLLWYNRRRDSLLKYMENLMVLWPYPCMPFSECTVWIYPEDGIYYFSTTTLYHRYLMKPMFQQLTDLRTLRTLGKRHLW